jgi:hypothetical protein
VVGLPGTLSLLFKVLGSKPMKAISWSHRIGGLSFKLTMVHLRETLCREPVHPRN